MGVTCVCLEEPRKPWQKLDMLATNIIMENQLFAIMQNIQGLSFLYHSLQ